MKLKKDKCSQNPLPVEIVTIRGNPVGVEASYEIAGRYRCHECNGLTAIIKRGNDTLVCHADGHWSGEKVREAKIMIQREIEDKDDEPIQLTGAYNAYKTQFYFHSVSVSGQRVSP